MLKRRRRNEQDELLIRQDAPAVALPKPPARGRRLLRPPAQPPLPAGTAVPAAPQAKPQPAPQPPAPQPPAPMAESGGVVAAADAPPRKRKRRRGLVLVFRQLSALAGIILAIFLGLPFLLRAERFRPAVEESLSAAMGRAVHIGALRFTLGLGGLIASDVTVAEDPAFGRGVFARASEARFGVRRISLLFGGSAEITSVEVLHGRIDLERNGGRWNFTTILTSGAAPQTSSTSLRLRDCVLSIRTGRGEPITLRSVAADFPRFSTAVESVFTISAEVEGGGALKLNGKAGPVIYNPGAPAVPVNALVNARKLALHGSGLTDAVAPALDGVLTLDGSIESDGALMTVNGNASIADLKLAGAGAPARQPVLLVFTVRHNLADGGGEIKRGEIHLGKGTAEVKGRYVDANGRAVWKSVLEARGLAAPSVASLLASAGIVLPLRTALEGGVGFAALALEGPIESPAVAGTVRLENAKLAGFDFEERFSSVSGLDSLRVPRDLAIDVFSAKVAAARGRIVLEEVEADLSEVGRFTGGGSVSSGGALDLAFQAAPRSAANRRLIPFIVRGTCEAPVFRQPGKM